MNQNKILATTQYGFKKGFCTIDAALHITTDIQKMQCATFLDFQGA